MRRLERIVRYLQRWVRRYRVVLNYDDTTHRRSIPREIEWNGEMIGEQGGTRPMAVGAYSEAPEGLL